MFTWYLLKEASTLITPNNAVKGHGCTVFPYILENASKIDSQYPWSFEQVQNMWRSVAGVCLQRSHAGSKSNFFILDSLSLDQCRRCTTLNWITACLRHTEDEWMFCMTFARPRPICLHPSQIPTCVSESPDWSHGVNWAVCKSCSRPV